MVSSVSYGRIDQTNISFLSLPFAEGACFDGRPYSPPAQTTLGGEFAPCWPCMSRAGGLGKEAPFSQHLFGNADRVGNRCCTVRGVRRRILAPHWKYTFSFFPRSAVPFHLCSNFVGPKIEYESPYRAWLQPQHILHFAQILDMSSSTYGRMGTCWETKKTLRYIRYTCILEKRWNRESWSSKSEGCLSRPLPQ